MRRLARRAFSSSPTRRRCTGSSASSRPARERTAYRPLSRSDLHSTHRPTTTMTTTYLWTPPPVHSLPVRATAQRLPINRLFFVGRNYHAHAVEMGRPVDKSVERPFYFTKSPSTLVESGATVAYPPETQNYQHEMELVVAIGRPGFRVTRSDAPALIYGYACGLDMTRRDL